MRSHFFTTRFTKDFHKKHKAYQTKSPLDHLKYIPFVINFEPFVKFIFF